MPPLNAERTQWKPGNIAEALAYHARTQPDATALTFLVDGERETVCLSFDALYRRAGGIAAQIRARRPNAERALILQAPGVEFVVSLCACFLAGVAAVPTPLPSARVDSGSARRFSRLARDAAPDVILTNSTHASRIQRTLALEPKSETRISVFTDDCEMAAEPFESTAIAPADLALIQYTSGSTGDPRGVLICHGNLAANLAAIAEKFELTRTSVVVNWLPPFHDMGLIGGILEAVWTGYHVVLMDPKHFIARPLRWMEAMHRFKADVSGGANFAYDLCADAVAKADKPTFDLSRWRLAYSGAEPVRAASIRRFSDAFGRFGFKQEAMYPCYGLAEATLMATGPDPDRARPLIAQFNTSDLERGLATGGGDGADDGTDDGAVRALVSCGTPCTETVLEIVDPASGAVLEEGAIGEIWLAGAHVFRGYHGDDKTISEPQRTLHRHGERPFLRTGDMGFRKKGELYVTGRLKDLMIFRGRNHFPNDIEDAVVVSHPMISPSGAAAFSVETGGDEVLIIACEIKREHRKNADWRGLFAAVRAGVTEQSGVMPSEIVLLSPGSLPRTTSGKIRRGACRDAYLSDDWPVLARASDPHAINDAAPVIPPRNFAIGLREDKLAALEEYLKWRISELTSMPVAFLAGETPIEAVGLDSLKRVEFALLIEQDLGVALPADWAEQNASLDGVADQIRKRLKEKIETVPEMTVARSGRKVALSPMQASFLEAAVANPDEFLEVLYFRTPKDLDRSALQAAFTALNAHHDAFALRFVCDDGTWGARYGNPADGDSFRRVDISALGQAGLAAVRGKTLADLKSMISISKGPLVAALLLDRGPGSQGLLVVAFHHLVVDAVSLSVWGTQFQDAYLRAKAGQSPMRSSQRNLLGAWLGALAEYGRSSAVDAELDYWQFVCGPARSVSVSALEEERRALSPQSLSASQNRIVLERFAKPMERQALFLAAITRAILEAGGEREPLILMESHGRHPFSGTDPSKAVGWFVSQYPVRIQISTGRTAMSDYSIALQSLQRVPNLGIGYGLLRARPKTEPNRIEMDALAKPDVFFQYRGNIDDTFRKGAILPVIGAHHEGSPYLEARRRRGDIQPLSLMAGLSKGTLFWSVSYADPELEAEATALSEGVGRYMRSMADLEP